MIKIQIGEKHFNNWKEMFLKISLRIGTNLLNHMLNSFKLFFFSLIIKRNTNMTIKRCSDKYVFRICQEIFTEFLICLGSRLENFATLLQ